MISEKVWHILRCPFCLGVLQDRGILPECQKCGEKYDFFENNQLDLRLKKKKIYPMEFGIDSFFDSSYDLNLNDIYWTIPFSVNNSPEVNFDGIKIPIRLNFFQLSHFPQAKEKGSLMLDLGCGEGIHREVCEHAGFEYVGLDLRCEKAQLRGDAHALPFADNCFEFILSIATLEHLRNPFIAIKEVHRVLKPGGRVLGTVAFLEPFHELSYYHHSHRGLYYLLKDAGLNIKIIGPNEDWPVLRALSEMILFPKLPKVISHALMTPIQILHRLWWKVGSKIVKSETAQESFRLIATAGSFTFVAEKET